MEEEAKEVTWEKSYNLEWGHSIDTEDRYKIVHNLFGIERGRFFDTYTSQSVWLVVEGEDVEEIDEDDARIIQMAISKMAKHGAVPSKDISIRHGATTSNEYQRHNIYWWPVDEPLSLEDCNLYQGWMSLKVRVKLADFEDPVALESFKQTDEQMTRFYQAIYKELRSYMKAEDIIMQSDCKMTQITREVILCPTGMANGGKVAE